MGSFIFNVLWEELRSGSTPEMQSEDYDRLCDENSLKYGGNDYKSHAMATAVAGYAVSEDYEQDKAVFTEIYNLLQPLCDKEVIGCFDFDSRAKDSYYVDFSMEFDIDEGCRVFFEGTAEGIVQQVRSYLNEHRELFVAREAAVVLVDGLGEELRTLPESGPYKTVFRQFDFSRLYGSGWSFYLWIKWNPFGNSHLLELVADRKGYPYKSSCLLMSGSKEDLERMLILKDYDLKEQITYKIPSLYTGLNNY